jgi:hypothetical protein
MPRGPAKSERGDMGRNGVHISAVRSSRLQGVASEWRAAQAYPSSLFRTVGSPKVTRLSAVAGPRSLSTALLQTSLSIWLESSN